ncbi:hypothetical protein RGR602_PB00387 (plasmid) [Rhizobium gallicum bv. gallicum R602sp]|uniref:Uncharacterized protein n=1 Tax=Rhizobium gallicum bv. gallicum R602sp TaxID=1041138 RepID=A0A0B4XBE6_9HYPH|nr:hypothetical protein RGR602_PB00387 [Rhizobium gallicum bv. gallicum R602sp]
MAARVYSGNETPLVLVGFHEFFPHKAIKKHRIRNQCNSSQLQGAKLDHGS